MAVCNYNQEESGFVKILWAGVMWGTFLDKDIKSGKFSQLMYQQLQGKNVPFCQSPAGKGNTVTPCILSTINANGLAVKLVLNTLVKMPMFHIRVSLMPVPGSSFLLMQTLGSNGDSSHSWVPDSHVGDLN